MRCSARLDAGREARISEWSGESRPRGQPDALARIRIRHGSTLTGINETLKLAASSGTQFSRSRCTRSAEHTPDQITVCGFAELAEECEAGPSHVLPLLDPDVPVPPELSSFAEDQRLEPRFPILSRSNRACARPNRSIFVSSWLSGARARDDGRLLPGFPVRRPLSLYC